jgi:predicted nucleotidyltransferase
MAKSPKEGLEQADYDKGTAGRRGGRGNAVKMITSDTQVSDVAEQIVRIAHPVRLILFGSRARGTAGDDSDVDVLVVVPEGTHRRRMAQTIYQQIRGVKVPLDIVVATPSDLQKYGNTVGLIYKSALRDGVDLYVGEE